MIPLRPPEIPRFHPQCVSALRAKQPFSTPVTSWYEVWSVGTQDGAEASSSGGSCRSFRSTTRTSGQSYWRVKRQRCNWNVEQGWLESWDNGPSARTILSHRFRIPGELKRSLLRRGGWHGSFHCKRQTPWKQEDSRLVKNPRCCHSPRAP